MLLVMVVHANYTSLGVPTPQDIQATPMSTSFRIFIEASSLCCVNVFVLISGYFGIHPKASSLSNFLFQIIFFFILIYGVSLAVGTSSLGIQGILQIFCLTPANWFIKAYLLLYVLSPVLNAFVEKGDRVLHRNVLVGFYLIQTLYGCLFAADFFESGYSTLSFIGLYLLARYVKIYSPKWSQKKRAEDIGIYLSCSVLTTIAAFAALKIGKNPNALLHTYINPLVVVEAVALLLFFSKLRFTSRLVNWVAASSFAVYLLHANPNILKGAFQNSIVYIDQHTAGIQTFLCIMAFLVLVFLLSICLDQIRKFTYELILKEICNRRMESGH